MNNEYTNPYDRLSTYYNLLSSENDYEKLDKDYDVDLSIKDIHELTEIPLEVIRNDFFYIFKFHTKLADNEAAGNEYIYFDTIEPDFKTTDGQNYFKSLLFAGKLDTTPISYIQKGINNYYLNLDYDEYKALSSLHINSGNTLPDTHTPLYDIKESYLYNYTDDLYDTLAEINNAINNKQKIRFRYLSSNAKLKGRPHSNITAIPLKLIYDSNENTYSLLAINSLSKSKISTYRLDLMSYIKIDSNGPVENIDESKLNIYPMVWGNSFQDKPEYVKVKFHNDFHVWDKVRQELEPRIQGRTNAKLYESSEYLFYEDTVYGIKKFRSWIYSFGRSAIVLEPESLRQEIINSLETRMTYYNY